MPKRVLGFWLDLSDRSVDMKRRILALLLCLTLLLGGLPGTVLAAEDNVLSVGDPTETSQIENTFPALADGVSATVTENVEVGSAYTVDLSTIFTDADGDALTYAVAINGLNAVDAAEQFSYTPEAAGTTMLVFVAFDGKAYSNTYNVFMTVTEVEEPALIWQNVITAACSYLMAQAETEAPVVSSTKGEWLVLGLVRNGVSAESNYFAAYYENVLAFVEKNIDPATGRLHAQKSTDNARVILALTALGKDVTNVGGDNLLKGLSNTDYVRKQGINGPVWALIALDSGNYEIPADADSTKQVTREWLVEYILSKQLTNGGWALSGQAPDDMTPMAIQALAPYYESNAEVKAAVDKAITAMAGMVDDSFDAGNSETLAQIIVALSAMGMDADTNSSFSKDGVSVVDALLRYSLESGAFRHGMGGGANQMSTEQAFYALVAYDRFKSGKTSLYDMSDALAEKFSVTVGEIENGTVTVDKMAAVEGETVTVTVSADTGYKLESLKMNGSALTVTGGQASFTMPALNVTITATFAKLDTVVEQETTVEGCSATVEISEEALKEAAEAVDEDNETITIIPTETKDAEKVEVKLPAQTVGEISEETDASIVVQAPVAIVEIANEILGTITKDATAESVISLIVEEQDAAHVENKTDEKLDTNGAVIVEVTLTVDGEKKTEFGNEKLTIFIPLSDNFREGMIYDVVVISDGRANETHRSECRKVDGKLGVELKINHLSTFVVLDSAVSELLDAMVELEVKDASRETYDRIMEIEVACDALTNVQRDSLEDAYDEFREKVEDFEDYLDEAIEDALDALDDYYDGMDKDDYSADNWSSIKDTRKWAKKEIKKAPYQEKAMEVLSVALELMKEMPKSGELTVTFQLIGDFLHDNGVNDHDSYVTWIETTEFEMESGDTMYDLFMAAMDEFDMNQRGASNNYVETIQAPDILGGYWLGEFDNGVNSGWMYTVNGVHPNVGLCYYELQDGDEVVWHYVDDYKLEERNSSSAYYYRWLEAEDVSPEDYVDELTERILTVGKHGEVDPAKLDSDDIGRNVTFRFKPDEGYKVENVIVDGKSMGSIEKYTYHDLSIDSRIEVTFIKKDIVEVSFDDVSADDWFYEDVQFVVENGLFQGTGDDVFSPAANMTRAMLVTVLYRLEGEPAVYGTSSFADVQNGKWYTNAVIWAAKNGIVSGYDNGLFGTNDNVTREQMAAILFRYASYKGYSVARNNNLSQYADAGEIHSYALSAMKWANAVGLINGRTNSTLVPGGTATRAEVAAIFHRFVENLVP